MTRHPNENAAPRFYAWRYKANEFWDIEKLMWVYKTGKGSAELEIAEALTKCS